MSMFLAEKLGAPEPYYTAYMFVMREAILKLRMWVRYGNALSQDQIHDLMDAIENIPVMLYSYKDWYVHKNIFETLENYDKKWANPDAPCGWSMIDSFNNAKSDYEKNGVLIGKW